MTKEFFNKQFAALWAAFLPAQKIINESQDVYWQQLRDIPTEKFAIAVRQCLDQCKYFPTIAELGEAALPGKNVSVRGRTRFVSIYLTWHDQVDAMQRWKEKIFLIEDQTQ